MARPALALVVLLACACAGDDGSASTTAPATTDDDGASTATAGGTGCAPTPDDVVHQRVCPLSQVCPVTLRYGGVLSCGGPLEIGKPYSSDERCVLTALAAGQPARVVVEESCDGARDRLTLDLLGGRSTILVHESAAPCDGCGCAAGSIEWDPVERCALVELDRFTACLDATTVEERVACLTPETWFESCGGGGPLCWDVP